MISSSRRRRSMTSRAWISMSVAWPWKPDETWWIRIFAFGQRHALALRPAAEQQRAHRHRDADADRRHVRLDELHRVVDRQARVHRAAGRVDVERDVLVGILGLEVQQLRHDEVRDLVVDRRAEEDDPLAQETGVDVERALSARGLFDDHWDEWAHGPRFVSRSAPESCSADSSVWIRSSWRSAWPTPSSRSSALRWARSALNVSSRLADFIRSSSFLALVPSCGAASSSAAQDLVLGRLDRLGRRRPRRARPRA